MLALRLWRGHYWIWGQCWSWSDWQACSVAHLLWWFVGCLSQTLSWSQYSLCWLYWMCLPCNLYICQSCILSSACFLYCLASHFPTCHDTKFSLVANFFTVCAYTLHLHYVSLTPICIPSAPQQSDLHIPFPVPMLPFPMFPIPMLPTPIPMLPFPMSPTHMPMLPFSMSPIHIPMLPFPIPPTPILMLPHSQPHAPLLHAPTPTPIHPFPWFCQTMLKSNWLCLAFDWLLLSTTCALQSMQFFVQNCC